MTEFADSIRTATADFEDVADLLDSLAAVTGWREVSDEWTYVSTTSVTVPTNATTKYAKGDRVRYKQGGSYEYGVITAVAATTLTINGWADYALANSAITDVAFSKALNPVGFPAVFNFTGTITGFSSGPASPVRTVSIIGGTAHIRVQTGLGTSNLNSLTVALPLTAVGTINVYAMGTGTDNGAYQNLVLGQISASGTTISFFPQGGSANWTTSGNKSAQVSISYEYA